MYRKVMQKIISRLSLLLAAWLGAFSVYAFDGTIDRQLEGTIISSSNAASAVKAFDDDASTYYSNSAGMMQWVGLDLGEPCVITRVGFTPAPGSTGADRALLSLFEGANSPDFMDALPLYLIGKKPERGTYTTADVDVSRGFRYVRYVGSSGSFCNIAELKFFGHPGEGDDSKFYQVTNLPTLSIHVTDNIVPTNRGQDFASQSVLIYEKGTMLQEYPVQFRVRGNYSATPENKAYRIKFDDGKSHHMMKDAPNESPTKCKKWVLINSWRDKTLMRNPVAWAMAERAQMNWTPWNQVVDLIVNGDYRGTYTLADAVSVNKGRINITEMTESDIDEETITGGYFVEVDNNAGREPYWFSSSHSNPITVHDPDEDIIQGAQFQYIRNTWNNMEDIVFGATYADKENGMRSVLDMESFLKYFLVSEFNGNTDMLCQVFFYKERGDNHFYTGPVWDAELALDDDSSIYPGNSRSDWTYPIRDTGNFGQFVRRVLSDPSVFAQLQEMWAKLRRDGYFNPNDVAADVDSLREELRSSATLNFYRWPYLNQYISLTPEIRGNWEAEVDVVRNYVRDRVAWMDNKLSYGKVRQENGIYQIGSALDLCTFSQMVNEQGETSPKAVLVTDIDMTDYNAEFLPIGLSAAPFNGSLDGKGHTISGLHLSGKDNVGLFGFVSGGSYSNIIFDETCSAEGQNNVSLLIGCCRTGSVTISGIENHGSVTASGNNASPLIGLARVMATLSVTDCSNTGAITAQTNAAALVSPALGKMSIANCYSSGTVTGFTDMKDFAHADKSLTLENCYAVGSTQVTNVTAQQVDNGYLCYQLNYNANSDSWRQNIDNGREHNLYPVRDKASGNVYEQEGIYTNINAGASTFRYYNLVITQLQGGRMSGALQFSEFDILDESLTEVRDLYVYGGCSDHYGNEGWECAADNNVGTKFCGPFNGRNYFLFDAGTEVDPFGYRIYTANDTQNYSERNPGSWKLYGSNTPLTNPNDAGWVLIDERNDDNTMRAANYTPFDFYIPHALRALTLDCHEYMLLPDEELQLTAVCEPASAGEGKLQWTSSNEEVAKVDQKGHVTAVGLGTAEITVSAPNYGTLRDVCTVTVVAERPGHRYYQFAIEAVGGNVVQLSEFDLIDLKGNEVKPLTMYACTGKGFDGEGQEKLFDDNTSTKFCGAFTKGNTLYIYIDAGQKVTLSGYRLTTGNDTDKYPDRNPTAWSVFGSNTKTNIPQDKSWVLLDHQSDDHTLGAASFKPFDFSITYPVPEPEVLLADVNGDGRIDADDVIAIARYLLDDNPEPFDMKAADVNQNGTVTIADLTLIINIIEKIKF